MNQRQKEKVIQEIIKVLSENNLIFADVPEILTDLENEILELSNQQIIQIP